MDTTARRYSIVLGQRMSWPDLLARARETESLGFDGLFLVDHFYGLFDLDHPTHEAYTMLAAVAPFTQSIRLADRQQLLIRADVHQDRSSFESVMCSMPPPHRRSIRC